MRPLILLAAIICGAYTAAASPPGERKAVRDEVSIAWYRNDVASLEKMSEAWRASKERAPSGAWKLALFYAAMQEILSSGNWGAGEDPGDDELLDGWQRAYPASPTPPILKGMLLRRRGTNASAIAASGRPPLAGWQPESAQLTESRRILESSKEIGARDPHWYAALIEVLFSQNAPVSDILILQEEALTAHPDYDATPAIMFTGYLHALAPSMSMIDRFASSVAHTVGGSGADAAYARVYMHVHQTWIDAKQFHRTNASWSRLRAGLEAIASQYPTPWNVSHLALFACVYGDHPAGRKAFAQLPASPLREIWKEPRMFDGCRKEMIGPAGFDKR